jgi:trigger factor
MKIQVERNDACEALLTVEIDPPVLESAMHKAARRLSEKHNLPGFRKGKAPYNVVLNAYGEDALLDEALDSMGSEVYRQSLEDQKLEPSAIGTMKRIVSRTPLVLEFVVPLKPEITLGDYQTVRLPFEEPAIPEEDVDRAMEQLRQSQSIVEPVDRVAQKGDVLLADIQTEALLEDGKTEPITFEGEENPVQLDLDENLGGRFPGAGDAMVGIAQKETRTVEIQYPESYPIARLRGMKARLTVRCLGVKNRQIPEWSDELAKTVGEQPTVDDLRRDIRQRLEKRLREEREEEYADKVIDQMLTGATVKYPQALLEEEIDEEVKSLERRLERRGMALEVYLRTIPEGMQGLRKEMEPDVRKKLARRLFLSEMVQLEKLEPSHEEVEEQLVVYRRAFREEGAATKANNASFEDALRNLSINDVLARLIVRRVVQIGRGLPALAADSTAAKPESS